MNSCCVIEINKFCEIFFTEAFIGCDISAGEEKIHKIWINSFIFFVRGNFIRFRWSLITWLVLRFRASFFLYPNIYSNWMKLFEHICKFIPKKYPLPHQNSIKQRSMSSSAISCWFFINTQPISEEKTNCSTRWNYTQ